MTHANIDLLKAAKVLNFTEYETYKANQRRANEDYTVSHEYNNVSGNNVTTVRSTKHPDAPSRVSSQCQTGVVVKTELDN